MHHCYDPDDESHDDDMHEELADYNDAWAESNEEGWFYSDED